MAPYGSYGPLWPLIALTGHYGPYGPYVLEYVPNGTAFNIFISLPDLFPLSWPSVPSCLLAFLPLKWPHFLGDEGLLSSLIVHAMLFACYMFFSYLSSQAVVCCSLAPVKNIAVATESCHTTDFICFCLQEAIPLDRRGRKDNTFSSLFIWLGIARR